MKSGDAMADNYFAELAVLSFSLLGDGVAQLVERWTRIQRMKVQIPSGAQEKFVRVFQSQKCCAE